MTLPEQVAALEAALKDFDPQKRAEALAQLAVLAQDGAVQLAVDKEVANLHCHTFFSFNAYGYSPSGLAWLAKKSGYRHMGIVDFDVLDGVDEFLEACELLSVRGSAGMETRVTIPEFESREINSPGEPGVAYYLGVGFTSSQAPPEVRLILDDLRQRAAHRNRMVVERTNDYLDPVRIDYDEEVIPLTPGGNPTERHIVQAYVRAAERELADPSTFWAEKLGISKDQAQEVMQDRAKFQNLVRMKLMKKGGPGYIQPTPDTFPTLKEVNRLIVGCGAIPCAGWLDGTSRGEQDMEELLHLLVGQGVGVLNIVPDRNWNIPDEKVRAQKVKNLYAVVELAGELDLPLNVGTEMNSYGQRWVDDFEAAELQPVREAFLEGADFMYGHTVMQRALGMGYESPWAKENFPGRRERNEFYRKVGRQVAPGKEGIDIVRSLRRNALREEFLRVS